MLVNMTVKEFLEELKSNSPAPGGGSVAALAGALGAALAIMVGNLTLRSEKYQTVHSETVKLQTSLEKKLDCLIKYIDEDTATFNQVMAAYKLPKNTEDEKKIRSAKIQTFMQQAAILPMNVALEAIGIMEEAARMLQIGNANAASDAAVAGRMAYAALWGAVYNVRINLGSIKDSDFVTKLQNQVETVLQKAEEQMTLLTAEANQTIKG